jgi:hypothetical protein
MSDEGKRALDMFIAFGELARQSIERNPRQQMAVPCKELAEAMGEVSRLRALIAKYEAMLEAIRE